MSTDLPITANNVDISLQKLVCKEKDIINNVSAAFKNRDSLDQFIASELGKLFGIVTAYSDCFQSLQIEKRNQLDSLIKKYYRTENIEDHSNQLIEAEADWDELLDQIDGALVAEQQKSPTINVGQCAPLESDLINVRDGGNFTLKYYLKTMDYSHLGEIKAAGGHVMLVTFGPLDGAKKWLEETKSSFSFSQDSSRNLYTAFGLSRSVKKVWCINSMVYYAEHMCSGQTLPKPYENYQEDIFQMGGDFIINNFGSVTFAYCSKTSADRPSVDRILQELQKTTSAE